MLDNAEFLGHQTGHRSIERIIQKTGTTLRPDMNLFDQDRPLIDRPQAVDDKDRGAEGTPQLGAFSLGSTNLLFGQDRRAGHSALLHYTFGKAGVGGGIVAESWRGHEPTTPVQTINEPFGL